MTTWVCIRSLISYHDAKESIVYSYTESFNAFAAKLSNDEAQKLQRESCLISVLYIYIISSCLGLKLINLKLLKLANYKCLGMDRVLSVFPNRYHQLHTTRSWDFIGLPQTARRNLKIESDIVVGLMDTGSKNFFFSFFLHFFAIYLFSCTTILCTAW